MSSDEWIDDLIDDSDDEDDGGRSLFEENFAAMVEDDEIEDMTLDVLEEQVQKIDDPEILADAKEVDSRKGAAELYQERIAEINKERQDDAETDQTDDVDEQSDEDNGVDDDGDDEEDVEDVIGDLTGEDDVEESEGSSDHVSEDVEAEDDPNPSAGEEIDSAPLQDPQNGTEPDLPDVDVGSLAPGAVDVETAAKQEKPRTMLVWGPEGSGKSHICHTAPEPICYIDTEGKATELASKFSDKQIYYFEANDYKEAKEAVEQSFDVLSEYLEAGVRGTLVVDSMTAMWEYAKVDWAKFAYQTEDLSEANFQSQLEGENDWVEIKARHNEEFRDAILEQPYNVVFSSGQKEGYYTEEEVVPDGEKWNRYAVKEVVQLRRDGEGQAVGDLRKAAKTRYSFVGLEWPVWDSIYEAIDRVYEAEQSPDAVDVSEWEFSVVKGQPVVNSPEGSDGGDNSE